ncbi:MAG TPA: M56 family metallopeptidase, partial [Patescibacteria group bacterium]|nr:M56 family metallopeptidase [Patescibacteria group bacterium]
MNLIFQTVWQALENWRLATVLVDSALKSFAMLLVAGACCLCWRRASAATRHWLWLAAIIASLSFPIMASFSWKQPLWKVAGQLDSGNRLTMAIALKPELAVAGSSRVAQTQIMSDLSAKAAPPRANWKLLRARIGLPWVGIMIIVWCFGFFVIVARALAARFEVRRLKQDSLVLLDDSWLMLLKEVCLELHLRRSVQLRQARDEVMPATWGWLRPVVLLPPQADRWPGEKRRMVLLHELAHAKRWDCASQLIAQLACAVYWFNPLVWVARHRMSIERERACDEFVVNAGYKASQYAGHLIEIAKSYSQRPLSAGIAIARSSQLQHRICSILQVSRPRQLRPSVLLGIWLAVVGAIVAIGGNQPDRLLSGHADSQKLLDQQLAQLRAFSSAKLKQSEQLATQAGEKISPEFARFFTAAVTGDSQTVTNMYEGFKRRHPQYSRGTNAVDEHLSTAYWSPVLEICLAYDHVIRCEPKYTALMTDQVIDNIPPGSIYFGGTDPGRGLPTAFVKSQSEGDPFFILTQNALADGGYLKYLRETYGNRIYTPSDADSQNCFNEYLADALKRFEHDKKFPFEPKQLRPGENVRMENGHGAVSGKVAVMSINALLAKIIFDRNPTRDFYIEESFPLDWMYPHLEPHGLIMRINREPLQQLSADVLVRDRAYWHGLVAGMVGEPIGEATPAKIVAEFVEAVYVKQDLSSFSGDRAFIRNDYAKRLFSKLRSSIAGVYAWRESHPSNAAEAERLAIEADLAFRQAYVLCPYSPEALFRYTEFLTQHHRNDDA